MYQYAILLPLLEPNVKLTRNKAVIKDS